MALTAVSTRPTVRCKVGNAVTVQKQDDLRVRFGRLVAHHRRSRGLTQQQLADASAISVDMINRVERGLSGARFPNIERLAATLAVDPAELFGPAPPISYEKRPELADLVMTLSSLSNADIRWIGGLVRAALNRREQS